MHDLRRWFLVALVCATAVSCTASYPTSATKDDPGARETEVRRPGAFVVTRGDQTLPSLLTSPPPRA